MARRDNPHDILFKEVFSRPAEAAALLRHVLPRAVSRRIRWHRLELQDSGVRVHHGERRADLLFRAPAPPSTAPFLVLEHKSSPDSATSYQVFGYVGGIWHKNHIMRRRRVVGLPAVFAVVVLHGRRRWRRGRQLADLIDWRWPAPGCMPSVPVFVLDLTGMSSEEIRSLPLPALAKVALLCLAKARDNREFLDDLRVVLPELRALEADDDAARGLESVVCYVSQVGKVPYADLNEFLESEVGPMAKQALMTTMQEATKEAREQAKAEGRAEGLAEGRAEAARVLLKLLAVRFGKLPASVTRRVRRATAEQRELWVERVLEARTLDEVLRAD